MLPRATLTIVVSRKVRNRTPRTVHSAVPRGTVRVVSDGVSNRQLGSEVATAVLHAAGALPSALSSAQKVAPATFQCPSSRMA